jgi:hypothetical protein
MLVGSALAGVYLFTTPGCACGNIFPERIYSLNALDPLRDRAPEREAQSFLRAQGQGQCRLTDPAVCAYALYSRRVLDWRLAAREDKWDSAVLYYRVKARDGDEFWGQAAVWVDRDAGGWKVVNYSAVY